MANGSVNKVILIGNLGRDPEIRYLPSGGAVANLAVATSEKWRDKQTGENREKTEWHRVVLFGKLADIASGYLCKGSQVYIEGQLQTREWDDNGVKRYTTEIVVKIGGSMQMLGGASKSAGSQPDSKTRHRLNLKHRVVNHQWISMTTSPLPLSDSPTHATLFM